MCTPRRIHVIGGPGSGKTTLARQLAVRLGAQAFDLDEVAYVGGAGAKRSLADRLLSLNAIVEHSSWVTEGIYLWWIDDVLESADAIVWLDVPWRIAAWRIVLRHVKTTLAGTNRHPGWWRLLLFLKSTRRYYVDLSPARPDALDDDAPITWTRTGFVLARYKHKVVRCVTSRDVGLFLNQFSWPG